MLDLAEVLEGVLVNAPVAFDDEQREQMALWLAEQKDVLSAILKNGKLPSPQAVENDAHAEDDTQAA